MATPDPKPLAARYGSRVEALVAALARDDEAGFLAVLDDILKARKPALIGELRDLTCNLQSALERFRLDARLADFAEKEIPDARQRLAHVLKLTDEAAHRTLDLIERTGPPAERTAKSAEALAAPWKRFRERRIALREFHEMRKHMDAFLPAARADAELIRSNLNAMLLTQAYQDLTGQIIGSVIELVGEIEVALAALGHLSGGDPGTSERVPRSSRGERQAGPGATHEGIATDQRDVDALLSGLGM